MTLESTSLARSITRDASKQSYYTTSLMVDRNLVANAYRAYAYFRWVDDFIDVHASTRTECVAFLKRQSELIDRSLNNKLILDLLPQEVMLIDLLESCPDRSSGLHSYIQNMMAIMKFDAQRRNHLITAQELAWYSNTLAKAVMDAIQYFIGNECAYPDTAERNYAAIGAHIAHMLRDTYEDTEAGFINIPRGVLVAHSISPTEYDSQAYRNWVRERVGETWSYFEAGKRYFDSLENTRCRIVGHWYCARFEKVLQAIEKDGYILRPEYRESKNLSTWLRMVWLGLSLPVRQILTSVNTP
jgi:phytoene/squalene synthetase